MVASLVGSPQFSDTPPIPGREPTTLRSVKTLVLGPGGREHAIVKALRADPLVSEVRCAPGNAGIAKEVPVYPIRSEEHTSELQSRGHLVCRLLLEKKKT